MVSEAGVMCTHEYYEPKPSDNADNVPLASRKTKPSARSGVIVVALGAGVGHGIEEEEEKEWSCVRVIVKW